MKIVGNFRVAMWSMSHYFNFQRNSMNYVMFRGLPKTNCTRLANATLKQRQTVPQLINLSASYDAPHEAVCILSEVHGRLYGPMQNFAHANFVHILLHCSFSMAYGVDRREQRWDAFDVFFFCFFRHSVCLLHYVVKKLMCHVHKLELFRCCCQTPATRCILFLESNYEVLLVPYFAFCKKRFWHVRYLDCMACGGWCRDLVCKYFSLRRKHIWRKKRGAFLLWPGQAENWKVKQIISIYQ